MNITRSEAKNAIETIVRYIENSSGELREGLVETPERVVKSWEEIFSGYALEDVALPSSARLLVPFRRYFIKF